MMKNLIDNLYQKMVEHGKVITIPKDSPLRHWFGLDQQDEVKSDKSTEDNV